MDLMVISLRLKVCWLRFTEETVNNGVDFEFHVLLGIKPLRDSSALVTCEYLGV